MNRSSLIIETGKAVLRGVYAPMKLRRMKKKITILSRQSNDPSLDIVLLEDYLRKAHPEVSVKVLCRKLEGGSGIAYGFHMLRQMWNMADSPVIVLDSYCIAASILDHRDETKVVQMWHALGAVKKFGYQSLGRAGGRSEEIARIMCMHRNYDYILAPSRVTGEFYCNAFGYDRSSLVYLGLPRIDAIMSRKNASGRRGEQLICDGREKEIILYAPTFRKSSDIDLAGILKAVDYDKYDLIICPHPLDETMKIPDEYADSDSITLDRSRSTYEWLLEADRIITDYSAMSIEAVIAGKPVYFYVYDADEYDEAEGLNVDPREEMPRVTAVNTDELKNLISSPYPEEEIKKIRDRYVDVSLNNCTGNLGDFIVGLIG